MSVAVVSREACHNFTLENRSSMVSQSVVVPSRMRSGWPGKQGGELADLDIAIHPSYSDVDRVCTYAELSSEDDHTNVDRSFDD